MAEFTYNNTKNPCTSYIKFELKGEFDPHVSSEENVDSHSRSRLGNKLANELSKLIEICY